MNIDEKTQKVVFSLSILEITYHMLETLDLVVSLKSTEITKLSKI